MRKDSEAPLISASVLKWKSSILLTALFGVLCLGASPVLAQHTVRGVVIDADDGNTLPGVNILVKGTTIGTATFSNGQYSLSAPSPNDTLVVSFIGYMQLEVAINGQAEVNIQLERSITSLDEVVVTVPYGEQTIATTTGSISQISGETLDAIPTTNLTQSLQGTVTGLVGLQTSGRPGDDNSTLLIRGVSTLNNNDPLVVIDGVPGRQGGLARLNPADIENITVLKDASAAIYGSRAANGVILVQTKRGRAGKARVSINLERGYSQPTSVPDMVDAPTYMTMLNEIDLYRGVSARFSQEQIDAHRNPDGWNTHNTDWYDIALDNFSDEIVATASVTGGSETFTYRISAEGVTEDGILVNSGTGYDQLGFRSNLDGDISDNLKLSLNLHGRLENRDLPAWTRGLNSAWELLQRGKPTEPAFWPNGQPGPAQENGVNPVVANQTGYDRTKTHFFQSSLTMNLDIPGVPGWSAEGTVAYDRMFEDGKRWQQPWTLYLWDGTTMGADGNPALTPTQSGVPDPRLEQSDMTAEDILLRATTRYEKSVNNVHNASLLLGTEWQRNEGSSLFLSRRFFPSVQIQELFAGGQEQQNLSGTSTPAATRLNYFGRLNYNFKQKYLFEFVARYDGSYIFPKDDRFGFFPSISAGWRIAQEDWFNNATNDFFDRLKLRVSYGQTGNDQIEAFQFLSTFGFNGTFAFGDGLGTRISPTRVPNENITWEVATQFDIGLQAGILDERVSFDLTYFTHDRDNILWFRSESLPESAGFSLPRENIARVYSSGFEAEAAFSQRISSNVLLRLGANLTIVDDKIRFFSEPLGVLPHQQNTDRPMNTSLYYVADGVYNDQAEIDAAPSWPGARPGDIKFVDVTGDGLINGEDRVRIEENSTPDLIGSFNIGAQIGQFNIALLFQGASQARHYVFTGSVGEFGNYFQEYADDRWTPDNIDGANPRAWNRVEPYWASNQNTFFLRDARYIRLKSANVSYSFPDSWLKRFGGMSNAVIYLSGRNLFTATPLEIMDPEIRNGGAHTYPLERAFTFGIQLGL